MNQKCSEVKKLVLSFPRPLEMVFEKADDGDNTAAAAGDNDDDDDNASVASTASSKKRWSLFGKKGGKDSDVTKDAKAAAAAAVAASVPEEDEGYGEEEEFVVTFEAGSLGLSVTNNADLQGNPLCVTKVAHQAEAQGVEVGDEITALNGKHCRGAKSDVSGVLVGRGGW